MGTTVTQEVLTGPFLGTSEDDFYQATTGGIVDASFQTQGGNDTISGNNDDGVGIVNTVIYAGGGNDTITARGTLFGVENVLIAGGAGNDTYDLQNGTGTIIDDFGIDDLLILEGQKSDYRFDGVKGIGNISIFDSSTGTNSTNLTVIGVDNFQFDDGIFSFAELFSVGQNIVEDQLSGEFLGTTEDDFYQATTDGIANASFATRSGDDTIIGDNLNDFGVGILNTTILTSGGDDIGNDGDNIITANATGDFSKGMVGVQITTGAGNDTITAGGTLLGVENIIISALGGNDTFDLQNGTGRVLGGDGTDLLILDGQKSDYAFIGLNSDLAWGEIVGSGVGTDLTVLGVENFQFSDGTFAFDNLFV